MKHPAFYSFGRHELQRQHHRLSIPLMPSALRLPHNCQNNSIEPFRDEAKKKKGWPWVSQAPVLIWLATPWCSTTHPPPPSQHSFLSAALYWSYKTKMLRNSISWMGGQFHPSVKMPLKSWSSVWLNSLQSAQFKRNGETVAYSLQGWLVGLLICAPSANRMGHSHWWDNCQFAFVRNLDLVEISAVGLCDTAHIDTKYRHGASNANTDIFNR